MLSSAEADLIRRDPAIPGLTVVFDPDAFVEALRRAAPEAEIRRAQITYIRYKPQAYCRVAYRLDLEGEAVDVDVRACRPDDLASWLQLREGAGAGGAPGRGHMVHMVLEDCAVMVSAFPNDLRLPGLQNLSNAEERKQVLSELLPDQPNLWEGELRCLRYRPERRYVAELRAADDARALVKSYTRKAYARSKPNAVAFQSSGRLRIARLLGCSDRRCLLAFEWIPGRLLFDFCAAPDVDSRAVAAAGAALAALHDQRPDGLWCWTREAAAADLVSLASEIGFICPRLRQRADELGRRLAGKLAEAPPMACPIHGDFSANQVIIGAPQVAIIDLDWACRGDPAEDLGNFVAQLERFALRGELTAGRVDLLKEAFLEGYGLATNRSLPQRIELHTAVGLFRRSRFPFRHREPEWLQRTEGLLDRAWSVMDKLG